MESNSIKSDEGNDNRIKWHMPAEWSKHLACLILYPHNRAVFRGKECEFGRAAVLEVAKAISEADEQVFLCCLNEEEVNRVQEKLKNDMKIENKRWNIHVRVLESDDTWARDTGPTFLTCYENETNEDLRAINWDFNAYGGPEQGCYWPCEKDKQISDRMTKFMSDFFRLVIPIIDYSSTLNAANTNLFVLEGGSIHVDGEGTVLTTEECLLHPNRNPMMTKSQIESKLLHSLGGKKVIWLPRGLYMDEDTNGHIDNFCCFVKPGHVVLAWTNDPNDPQYEISNDALTILKNSTDASGRKFKVTKLVNPPPLYYTNEEIRSFSVETEEHMRIEGSRLAASYVNFYIANEAIIVPGFGVHESDLKAVQTLQGLFPGRRVVQIASREILLGGGNIHCITQQLPKPTGK